MAQPNTRTQYRVMARAPDRRRFTAVTAPLSNLDTAQARVRLYQSNSPGWEYRIDYRRVITTPWKRLWEG